MIVFVTGATGVLGRPVVEQLIRNGHEVRALSRSATNRDQLIHAGAVPLAVDLYEPMSLATALRNCDAVLHLATRIPGVSQLKNRNIWEENDRIRPKGTRFIVEAIRSAPSVRTLIYPSISLFYGDGGQDWISAETATIEPCAVHLSTLAAENDVRMFAEGSPDRKGIVLRFGSFYGPASPDSIQTMGMVHKGMAMPVASGDTYKSMIWIDDAAHAVIDALERAPSGTYDVVEDIPSTQQEALDALALPSTANACSSCRAYYCTRPFRRICAACFPAASAFRTPGSATRQDGIPKYRRSGSDGVSCETPPFPVTLIDTAVVTEAPPTRPQRHRCARYEPVRHDCGFPNLNNGCMIQLL
ncbi:MAG: NAD(P)-dependent oxidoreductase [Hyphomicrobiales bacterium]|nr:NAD(P)-dependent oxidoreductase [Hyphomicrobiales bacterium]MCP4999782.1 NAD(P)-dependent oxidoreductase [Hyphomicrobiales bacterium]